MNRLLKIFFKLISATSILVLFSYAAIQFRIKFLSPSPKSDEHGFLNMFEMFLNEGYFQANVEGNSIVFNLISYLYYSLGFSELQSLRLTSFTAGIASLILLWVFIKKFFSVSINYKIVAYITAVHAMVLGATFMGGINDVILVFLTLSFFFIIYSEKFYNNSNNRNYFLLGVVIAMMLLTRMMSALYLLPIAIVIAILFHKKSFDVKQVLSKSAIIITVSTVLVLAFNWPSLVENGSLSFHIKKTKFQDLSWSQLQYLSAMRAEDGTLEYAQHVSWEDVRTYLDENGEDALPNSLTETLLFNPSRTIKEFFVDVFLQIKPFTRILGIIFIFNLLLFFYYLFKRKLTLESCFNQDILIFSIIYIFSICFIVIYVIENRWFGNIFLLLPIVFCTAIFHFFKDKKDGETNGLMILNLQLLSLIIMSLPFILKNYHVLV